MTKPLHGKIHDSGLELPSACDICGRNRGHGNHSKCSKERQARYAKEARNGH